MEHTAREIIAGGILEQAREWRSWVVQYPDDPRHRRAASGLHELAAYVRTLPDDDARLCELESLCIADGRFSPGIDVRRQLLRFRFRDPDEPCGAFLDKLVRVAVAEAVDALRLRDHRET